MNLVRVLFKSLLVCLSKSMSVRLYSYFNDVADLFQKDCSSHYFIAEIFCTMF